MKQSNNYNHEHLLKCLASLPKKMLKMHGTENLTEFVLHDLCNHQCFDLSKAAYFVDNPDFDYLKGVAGFDSQDDFVPSDNLWDNPDQFSKHMSQCEFNQIVRKIEKPSFKRANQKEEDLVEEVCIQLGIEDPIYYCWNLKNDNHGIFVFEKPEDYKIIEPNILEGLCLLGFCPVF